jgi:hypothetical protein
VYVSRDELLKEIDGQLSQWRHLPDDSRVTISVKQVRVMRSMVPSGRLPPHPLGGVPAARMPHQHPAVPK